MSENYNWQSIIQTHAPERRDCRSTDWGRQSRLSCSNRCTRWRRRDQLRRDCFLRSWPRWFACHGPGCVAPIHHKCSFRSQWRTPEVVVRELTLLWVLHSHSQKPSVMMIRTLGTSGRSPASSVNISSSTFLRPKSNLVMAAKKNDLSSSLGICSTAASVQCVSKNFCEEIVLACKISTNK